MSLWKAGFTAKDSFNRLTTRETQIEALDYVAALAAAAAWVGACQNIMLAEILKYKVWQDTAFIGTLGAGANVDAGVTFSFEIGAIPGKVAATKLPAPILTIFDANGAVDLTDAGVTAYASEITGDVRISDGEQATALKSGKLDR